MLKIALLLLPLAGTAGLWLRKNASPLVQRLVTVAVIHVTAALAVWVQTAGTDPVGGWYLLLVNAVFVLSSWGFLLPGLFSQRHAHEYRFIQPDLLLLLAALNGIGLASGPVFYYVALESALFAIWLCLGVGSIEAPDVRGSLIAFSLGTGLVLAGLVLLSPGLGASFAAMDTAALPPLRLTIGAALAAVGLAVCTGLAPAHGWLPAVVARLSRPAGMLVAILVPCAGLVGWLRLLAALAPPGTAADTLWLMRALGLATMAAAVWGLAVRRQEKAFFAHAAVFHTGAMVFAVGMGGPGVWAGLLHGSGRALVLAAVFMAGSALVARGKELDQIRGAWRGRPFVAAAWFGSVLAWCCAPPFPLFASVFASVFAVANRAFAAAIWWWGGLFALLLFLGAIAFAAPGLAALAGTAEEEDGGEAHSGSVWAALLALAAAATLGLGVPDGLADLLTAAANTVLMD